MKTILVPTDFSDCSMFAVEYAVSLAKKINGKIYLLHILDLPAFNQFNVNITGDSQLSSHIDSENIPYMITLLREVKIKMKKLKSKPMFTGIQVIDNIEIGSVSKGVTEAAKKYNADIIVMGTHGTSGMNEHFIGSNTEKVVRLVDRRVFCIKHKLKSNEIKKIVFATDFSNESYNVFPALVSYAEINKAKIYLLKVNTMKAFSNTRKDNVLIEEFYKRTGKTRTDYPVTLYNDETKETGIIHFSDEIGADLIAIGTHGRSGLSAFFNKSISKELVNHSFLPVLTINFRKKK